MLAFGIGAGVWYSSGVGHVSEAKYDETCVKNEAFRGYGMRIGAWALGAEAFSSQEVEEE